MGVKPNNIYLGDCLKIMPEIEDSSIDMILCDLPYGKSSCKWDVIIPFKDLWEQYKRIIKDNGAICLFGTEPFSSHLRISNLKMYKYDWIWEKENGSNFTQVKWQPFKVHEHILIFGNFATAYTKTKNNMQYYPQFTYSNPYKIKRTGDVEIFSGFGGRKDTINSDGKRYPRSIQKFSMERGLHPTQKPVKLLEYLIKTYTQENEIVLDNCLGSGSTAIACINTNRNYIGIEKEKKYYEIAKERIENAENTIL